MAEGARSALSRGRFTSCIWELTYRCNCRCGICPYWQRDSAAGEELTLAEIRQGLDRIYASGVRFINFSGGEPTLREDLEDIVRHASRRGFWTSMVTNGSLLDGGKIAALKDAGLDNLFVSVDSVDGPRHDSLRGMEGLHDRALRALSSVGRCFVDGHRSGGIMCVVSSLNRGEMEAIACLALDLGVYVVFQLYHENKTGRSDFAPAGLDGISSTLLDLKRRMPNVISSEAYLRGMASAAGHPSTACRAGRKYFGIDPHGGLHPCVDLPEVGHVLSDDLKVLLGETSMAHVRACRGCWYCFRGEADVSLSLAGTVRKGLQYLSIMTTSLGEHRRPS
jgi:pyrroloquinoline quinone biosynthesis protein E